MCRNIKQLYNFEPVATQREIKAAALQYVRKVSGFREPSQANLASFNHGVEAIARATQQLLGTLNTQAVPKNREIEAAKTMARSKDRYKS